MSFKLTIHSHITFTFVCIQWVTPTSNTSEAHKKIKRTATLWNVHRKNDFVIVTVCSTLMTSDHVFKRFSERSEHHTVQTFLWRETSMERVCSVASIIFTEFLFFKQVNNKTGSFVMKWYSKLIHLSSGLWTDTEQARVAANVRMATHTHSSSYTSKSHFQNHYSHHCKVRLQLPWWLFCKWARELGQYQVVCISTSCSPSTTADEEQVNRHRKK